MPYDEEEFPTYEKNTTEQPTRTYAACTELLAGEDYKQRVFDDKLRRLLSLEWERCAKGATITVNGVAIARERYGSWTSVKNGKEVSWRRFVHFVRAVPWLDHCDAKKKRKHFAIEGTDCEFDLHQGTGWEAEDFTPYIERALSDDRYALAFVRVVRNWCDWPCEIAYAVTAIVLARFYRRPTAELYTRMEKKPTDVAAVTDLDAATKAKVAAVGAWIEAMRSISGPASKLVVDRDVLDWDAVDMHAIGEKIACDSSIVYLRVADFAGTRGTNPRLEVFSAMHDLIDAVCTGEMAMTAEAAEAKLALTKAMAHTPGGLAFHQTLQVLSQLTANK